MSLQPIEPSSGIADRILVVDDEPDICEILKAGLEKLGYVCGTAQDVDAACAILEQDRWDLVVTDIHMPGRSGIDLCRHVVDRYDSDIVVMTGYTEEFSYEEIVDHGASDFIRKPVPFKEFVARIRRVLAARSLRKERNRVQAELKSNFDRLRVGMEGFVRAMSLAVEMRDPYTAGHQRRAAALAVAIARELGLPADQCYGLEMIGIIHDLGKIQVPTEILCKPGKLTELEYALIRTHPQAGYDILKGIDFPWPMAEVIFQHHERLDGSGYPRGIAGNDILMETRILMVADVIETMATHRPYRPAIGVPEALEEIRAHRGVWFDPDVVTACIRVVCDQGFSFN